LSKIKYNLKCATKRKRGLFQISVFEKLKITITVEFKELAKLDSGFRHTSGIDRRATHKE
jgi:hypothetical protein